MQFPLFVLRKQYDDIVGRCNYLHKKCAKLEDDLFHVRRVHNETTEALRSSVAKVEELKTECHVLKNEKDELSIEAWRRLKEFVAKLDEEVNG